MSDYDSDDTIEFKKDRERKCIAVWLTPDEKATYDLLSSEYGVKMHKEMQKAASKHIEYLRAAVIKRSAG